ncbi:MAG: YciI family protein [Proteobacteria bacterium]|nr:YciI family protein [Pseudomonadota bacterium]MDA1132770.1 YciI family protein [Pseudomonadota bacterium]
MPLFAIVAIDRPGRLDRRRATRDKHLAHLKTLGDRLRIAGPFTAEDGTPCGSMLVIEADDLDAAEALAAADPYFAAGVFESVTVRPWKNVVGSGIAALQLP